ncbi:MAG: PilZ domain-containing protein [Halieaceae bacterium]
MESLHDQGTGLTYREKLPLRLRRSKAVVGTSELMRNNASNEMLLRACLAIHDLREPEERDEVMQEMARLELKMNLLISVVQQLVSAQAPLPATVPIVLTAAGLSWPEQYGAQMPIESAPGAGDKEPLPVQVDIFISPLVSLPLSLYGTLSCVTVYDDEGSSSREWQCSFDTLGANLVDLLEKLIFSFHRREVAMERAAEN